ncbi:hypothetical protein [Thalassolituus sp.]|jgi:uncharacterized membrane protein|uniref:hypothetical protein n=1 Tax=Thalassolituus sp. TaxID=2030822 RepID=UPI002A7EED2C|nr:hypothetical protein [Thalassolituus sp.]
MTQIRTALADYLTILTSLSTILTGLYAIYSGSSLLDNSSQQGYWDGYLRHAIAVAITTMALYFFLDQSVKVARRIVESGSSALPKWLVYGLFYFGGMIFFTVFQIVLQSNMFDEVQLSYFIIPLIIWLSVTIPLMLASRSGRRSRR